MNRDSLGYAGKNLLERLNFSLRYYYRPGIRTRHFFRLSFNHVKIDSAVLNYNPELFSEQQKAYLCYPELSYSIRYNNIDYVPYPTKGFFFEGGLLNGGFHPIWICGSSMQRPVKHFPLRQKCILFPKIWE